MTLEIDMKSLCCSLLVLQISILFFCGTGATQGTILDNCVENGGYLVADQEPYQIQQRSRELFIPASTLKILTSLYALKTLGPTYRFQTHIYIDSRDNLYIKGFGDPFLISEELFVIARAIKESGITKIRTLYLDSSAFALTSQVAGSKVSTNPYDAANGALCVNFNTVKIEVGDDQIRSAEVQTPTLPLMKKLGNNLPTGTHRVNIQHGQAQQPLPQSLQHSGELFIAQFEKAGIHCSNKIRTTAVPEGLSPRYIHQNSRPLREIIQACLRYSNNYIANQLFLIAGAERYGYPATWEKAQRGIREYLGQELHLSHSQVQVLEGSGLSRDNKISAEALAVILDHFKPFADLLKAQGPFLPKSGTLTGVYCYAGYFRARKELTPFVILLNQEKNCRDNLLKHLYEQYRLRP